MILHKLRLENFKQYTSETIEFREDLVGITGRNGAGKSSIFEAILLALFGSFNVDNAYLRSSWADTKAVVLVELEFSISGKKYQVKRQFRGKSLAHHADLYEVKGEEPKHLATSANEVKRYVRDLLGMDKEAFTKSVFSGQKELDEISKVQGSKRKEMIRKMVGLDKLDTIQRLIRRDANVVKNEIAGQTALLLTSEDLATLKTELKDLNKQEIDLKKVCTDTEKQLKQQNESYQTAKIALDAQQTLRDLFNEKDKTQSNYVEGVKGFKETLEKQETERKNLLILKKSLEKQQPEIKLFLEKKINREQLEKEKKQFDQVQLLIQNQSGKFAASEKIIKEIEGFEKEIKPLESIESKVETLENQRTVQETIEGECMKVAANVSQKIGDIKGKIKERQENIATMQNLGKDADCPTCLRPLVESYDATLKKLSTEISTYENKELKTLEQQLETNRIDHEKAIESRKKIAVNITELKNQQSAIRTKVKEIEKRKTDLNNLKSELKAIEKDIKSIGKITFDQQTYETLTTEIKAFEPSYIAYEKNRAKTEKITEVETEIETLKGRIDKGNQYISNIKTEIKDLNFSLPAYQAARQKREDTEAQRDSTQAQFNREREALADKTNNIKKIQHRLDTHKQTQAAIKEREQQYIELEELGGVFGRFKNDILGKVRPMIAGKAGKLFKDITKNRYERIQINDNFNFEILDEGKLYPIERFSGGEIDLANLCLRIGISEAVAQLAGSDRTHGFLGFDEIFGSQDDERRQEIMHALQVLKQQYKQIYIVTHINDVKEEFSEILEVQRMPEGNSRATWLA